MNNKMVNNRGQIYTKKNYKQFNKALIKLKPSKLIKGEVGVFAVRNLKKGTVIGDIKFMEEELFFTWDDYKKIDKESKELIINFCVAVPDGFYAPRDINYLSAPWYINHSCNGNVGHDKNGSFITIKSVKKNEELCYDYGFAASSPNFKLKCKCKSKNCRKIVTGNDWKNSRYRKINYKYMTPELKELIIKTIKQDNKKI